MRDNRPRNILVAVETAACDAALELAAVEARARRCGVHLAHVMHPVVAGSHGVDPLPLLVGDLNRLGHQVLDDAAAKLEHLLIEDGDLPVSTELLHGAVVLTLVAESINACLVVVQHRGMGPEGATPVLSVTNGVAARAHAPVVAVPSLWCHDAGSAPVLSVGVEDRLASLEVVRVALQVAERDGARVRLVHAVRAAPSLDPELAGEGAARLGEQLSAEFADLLAQQPRVAHDALVAKGSPAELLLQQAESSTMLVVGRRHPRLPVASHLGPVAKSVLRWSPVPVLVVDPVAPNRPAAASTRLSFARV